MLSFKTDLPIQHSRRNCNHCILSGRNSTLSFGIESKCSQYFSIPIHNCFFSSSFRCTALKTTCLGHLIIWISYSSMLKTWPKKRCHGTAKQLVYCGVREGIHSSFVLKVAWLWSHYTVSNLGSQEPWIPAGSFCSWLALTRKPKWSCPLQSCSCKTWPVHSSGQKLALVLMVANITSGLQYCRHVFLTECKCSGFCTWVWIKFHMCIPQFPWLLCQYSCYFSCHDHWKFFIFILRKPPKNQKSAGYFSCPGFWCSVFLRVILQPINNCHQNVQPFFRSVL